MDLSSPGIDSLLLRAPSLYHSRLKIVRQFDIEPTFLRDDLDGQLIDPERYLNLGLVVQFQVKQVLTDPDFKYSGNGHLQFAFWHRRLREFISPVKLNLTHPPFFDAGMNARRRLAALVDSNFKFVVIAQKSWVEVQPQEKRLAVISEI